MRLLSPRLQCILELGLPEQDFWDVCCDHGYLGEHALASGRFHKVYFVDRIPHIIASIKIRLGPESAMFLATPAEEIDVPMSGTIVLAGVGGHTITKILKLWHERGVLQANRLILNPLTHVEDLRLFLQTWSIYPQRSERSVMEGRRPRDILILDT